jgi:hypothetical protein
MSASPLTMDRLTDQLGTPEVVLPQLLYFPVEANTTIYGGALVCTNASGNAVPASATSTLICWGRAERQQVNTTAAGVGAAGALSVTVHQGVFFFNNSTISAVSAANVGQACYAENDNVISLTSQGGTLPFAGTIVAYSEQGLSEVGVAGQVGVLCGIAMANAQQPSEIVRYSIPLSLATIQAQASGTAFNIGSVLPTNARVIRHEVDVVTQVTGGSLSAVHITLQGGTDSAGSIQGSTDVFTAAGYFTVAGSNDYATRGGQQLKATLTSVGDTLADATAGSLVVNIYYAVVP